MVGKNDKTREQQEASPKKGYLSYAFLKAGKGAGIGFSVPFVGMMALGLWSGAEPQNVLAVSTALGIMGGAVGGVIGGAVGCHKASKMIEQEHKNRLAQPGPK